MEMLKSENAKRKSNSYPPTNYSRHPSVISNKTILNILLYHKKIIIRSSDPWPQTFVHRMLFILQTL